MTPLRLAIEALRWLAGAWLLWSLPGLRPAGAAGADDAVLAVVVPARDEAATLPRLLEALRAQTRPPSEVVVVDDHSTDGTADLARAAGATVVAAPALPGGWTGKAWACWTGAHATTAPVLVFLDADTWPAPDGLARLAGELRHRGGLVSVQPFHVTERPYEALSAFFNVVALMGIRPRRPAGAAGPCMACARTDYLAVGGHAAVRAEVAEDLALGRRFLAAGLPLACLAGREAVRFRMYPGGLGSLVAGWTKNFATGAGATRPAVVLAVVAWVSGCISAAAYPLLAALGRSGVALGWAAALYAAYAAQLAWMLRRVGRFPWWAAAAFPVPLAAFLAVFARSLALTVAGRPVAWRGRAVPSRPDRGKPDGGRLRRIPARMDRFQYLILLTGCLVLTLPLEFLFGGRVWRRPRRLLRALAPPFAVFVAWDFWAASQGHWSFSDRLTTGVELPYGVPVDELFFFVAIPICALLTLEAVRNVLAGRVRLPRRGPR